MIVAMDYDSLKGRELGLGEAERVSNYLLVDHANLTSVEMWAPSHRYGFLDRFV